MYDDDLYDEEPPLRVSGVGVLTVVLPFLATIASLLFGIVIGGVAGWVAKPTDQPIEYLRSASLTELEQVCEPMVEEKQTQLAEVNEQIDDLRTQVREKEARLAELQTEMERRRSAGARYAGELQRVKEELAEAKLQLEMLQEEKQQLVEALTRTAQKLARVESDLAVQLDITAMLEAENGQLRDNVLAQKWGRFVNAAKLDICEKGNRKRMGACRETVHALLDRQVAASFAHCVRSGQATPTVQELGKDEQLPTFSRFLDEDDRIVRGWYLQLCDPTLPENDATFQAPPTYASAAPQAWDGGYGGSYGAPSATASAPSAPAPSAPAPSAVEDDWEPAPAAPAPARPTPPADYDAPADWELDLPDELDLERSDPVEVLEDE